MTNEVVLPNGTFVDGPSTTPGARDLTGYGYMDNLLALAQGQLMVAAEVVENLDVAAGSASAAAASTENAAGYAQTALEKAAQTVFDRIATGEDRVATGQDRTAVADMLESIADGPVTSVNGKTGPVTLTATDIAPAATPEEMAAGTETGYRSMSPALVANAITAKTAVTGDLLITGRNPGAGWLAAGTVYLQSAYTALFAQVGLIKDQAFSDAWGVKWTVNTTNGARGNYFLIRLSATTLVAVSKNSAETAYIVYRSINDGGAWEVVYTFPTNRIVSALARLSDTSFLIGGGRNDAATLFIAKFVDSGVEAPSIFDTPASNSFQSFGKIFAINGSLVYAVDSGAPNAQRLYKSTDGGGSFTVDTSVLGANNVQSISKVSDSVFYGLASSGTVLYKSIDGGGSVVVIAGSAALTPIGSGGNVTPTEIFAISENLLLMWGPANGGAMGISRNGGVIWQKQVYFVYGSSSVQTGISISGPSPVVKLDETTAVVIGSNNFIRVDVSAPGTSSTPFVASKLPPPTHVNGGLLLNSPTEALLYSPNSNQVLRSSLYSYDETTQFKTPSVAGIIGAAAYVKA